MNEIRELRRTARLALRTLAEVIGVPVNTCRMWDSGLRRTPVPVLHRARAAISDRDHQNELLPLDRLASELGAHLRNRCFPSQTARRYVAAVRRRHASSEPTVRGFRIQRVLSATQA